MNTPGAWPPEQTRALGAWIAPGPCRAYRRTYTRAMLLPFLIFWILLILGRKELGRRWVLILVAIWACLLAAFVYADLSPYLFVAAQALIDAILILVLFKGDIRIR